MEAEKSPKAKRERKAPTRFQVWKEGDSHSPMAVRQQKTKKKKEQKKFRQMREAVSAEVGPGEGSSKEPSKPSAKQSKKKKTGKQTKAAVVDKSQHKK